MDILKNRILEYDDFYKRRTKITMFPKGTLNAPDFEFKCGDTNALVHKTYGDRFDTIRPSDVKISITIVSQAEEDELLAMVGQDTYVTVEKEGNLMFIGRMTPAYFTIPYNNYPYTVTLTAKDQLTDFKSLKMLDIDFNQTFKNHKYTMYEVLKKILYTDKTLGSFYPSRVNVYNRIHSSTINFKDIVLDPLVFMKEGEREYITKWDMLTGLLKPLNLTILQYKGEWWIVSQDATWDNGAFTVTKWHLDDDTESSDSVVKSILAPFTDPTCVALNDNPILDWYPINRYFKLNLDYQRNDVLSANFTNRKGGFYKHPTINLEIDTNNHLNPLRVTGDNGMGNGYGLSGQLFSKATTPQSTLEWKTESEVFDGSESQIKLKFKVTKKNTYSASGTDVNLPHAVGINFKLELIYDDGGTTKHLWLKPDSNDPNIKWTWVDTDTTISEVIDVTSYDITVDNPKQGTPHSLMLSYHTISVAPINPNLNYWLEDVHLSIGCCWDCDDYKQEIYTDITDDTLTDPMEESLRWGFVHPASDRPNGHAHHLSAMYDNASNPDTNAICDGKTGTKQYIEWFTDYRVIEISQIMGKLSLNVFTDVYISPFTILKDVRGKLYKMESITYNDVMGIYEIIASETKHIALSTPPASGDFNLTDFNDDFYK